MTFPRYADYKDSGVEWLGEVPAHWGVVSLKRDIAFLTSGSRGWAEHYSDDGVLFLRIGNLTRDSITLDLSDIQRVNLPDGAEGERTRVVAGDVLFSITAYLGSVAVAPKGLEEAYVSQHVALVRLHQRKFIPAWVGYVTLSNIGISYLETRGYGGTKVQLSLDDVANLIVTTPPLPEQTAIAAFLDHETGKIDALVAEQEKLIALLKEKRQAVISHAVTKGLDPSVPLKDSGIEWLGEVPEHWEISRMKHLCSHVVDCLHTTPTYDGELEYPAIRTADVDRGILLLDQARLVSREIYEERIQRLCPMAGDILYSREGERFGMAALVPEDVNLCLGQRMMMFRTNERAHPAFMMWLLNSDAVYQQVLEKVGGSTSPHVNISDIINFHVPLPPKDEQSRIAERIAIIATSVDTLTAEAERAIALLKERRSALISAAVTGKIDVRWFVAPTPQEAA
ncbi:restriction endonuclease subunit S [Insolitispirillum peregrinum]|uniref:Type I restriction enzyme, S subunit n=1 Tax=Insolitispirillum peregrinum TaxID=80876 RepID=A0A1N7IMK1_9PROT|nr:restriction endonuclease subunit S [Insolitispirillum peregrinum]SIS38282.1 type I restriction enzyme, S subunit [Insolitispirillum peregrinum]